MYLKENVWEYDQDRVGQIEDEPDLDRLDVGGAGEAGGHGDVEGGEDHHAGDAEVRDEFRNTVVLSLLDCVDQVISVVSSDIVGGCRRLYKIFAELISWKV